MPVLEEEKRAFEEKKGSLLEGSEGRYVVISGSKVIGVYDTEMDAARAGFASVGNKAFLIRKVERVRTAIRFASAAVTQKRGH